MGTSVSICMACSYHAWAAGGGVAGECGSRVRREPGGSARRRRLGLAQAVAARDRWRLGRRGPGLDRELDREGGTTAGRALDAQRAAVLPDDAVGDAEPEPGAVALGGDERVEHLGDDVGGDARS